MIWKGNCFCTVKNP